MGGGHGAAAGVFPLLGFRRRSRADPLLGFRYPPLPLPRGPGVTLHRAPGGVASPPPRGLPSWRAPPVLLSWLGLHPAPSCPAMGAAVFFGCTFVAFGPAFALFLITVAGDPLRVIILVAG